MSNLQRTTTVCLLAYFVMSGMLNPIGVITGPMAEYFHRPITDITASFSWLTGGIFAGSLAALLIYEWMHLKYALLSLYGLILVCLCLLPLQTTLAAIWPMLGLVGACCGAGLAGAAITISASYERERRASMLVITDGCFSIAGIVISWLAVLLLARNIEWYGSYLFIALITGIVLMLTALSTFPEQRQAARLQPGRQRQPWPVGTWICIFTLLVYTLSQYSLLFWLPNYAETQLGIARNKAGLLVSRFWTGMLIAQLFTAWWVLKIGVRRTVIIGAVAGALATIPLWLYRNIEGLFFFTFVCGLVNLGFLKITLSLAIQMMRSPPPRLVSALLLGATTGTSIAPWLSSAIVKASSNYIALIAASAGYFIVAILIIVAIKLSPEKLADQTVNKPGSATA